MACNKTRRDIANTSYATSRLIKRIENTERGHNKLLKAVKKENIAWLPVYKKSIVPTISTDNNSNSNINIIKRSVSVLNGKKKLPKLKIKFLNIKNKRLFTRTRKPQVKSKTFRIV